MPLSPSKTPPSSLCARATTPTEEIDEKLSKLSFAGALGVTNSPETPETQGAQEKHPSSKGSSKQKPITEFLFTERKIKTTEEDEELYRLIELATKPDESSTSSLTREGSIWFDNEEKLAEHYKDDLLFRRLLLFIPGLQNKDILNLFPFDKNMRTKIAAEIDLKTNIMPPIDIGNYTNSGLLIEKFKIFNINSPILKILNQHSKNNNFITALENTFDKENTNRSDALISRNEASDFSYLQFEEEKNLASHVDIYCSDSEVDLYQSGPESKTYSFDEDANIHRSEKTKKNKNKNLITEINKLMPDLTETQINLLFPLSQEEVNNMARKIDSANSTNKETSIMAILNFHTPSNNFMSALKELESEQNK